MKKLPLTLLLGALVPLAMSLANRFFPPEGTAAQIAKHPKSVDILAIATVVTVWTAVLTVAIGCFVVMIMKGHAYVADAYELSDSERPKPADALFPAVPVTAIPGRHRRKVFMLRCRQRSGV